MRCKIEVNLSVNQKLLTLLYKMQKVQKSHLFTEKKKQFITISTFHKK